MISMIFPPVSYVIAKKMKTVVQRTGSGKSTIFKLILGLYEPQSGEVYICGRKAQNIPDEEKRKMFGYVEQTFHMVLGTVKDQITANLDAQTEDCLMKALKRVSEDRTVISISHRIHAETGRVVRIE